MTSEPFQPVAQEPFQPTPPEPAQPVPPTQPPAPASAPRSGSSASRWINGALGLALVVAVGGVAFAAGRMTAPAPTSAFGGDGNRTFQLGGGYFPGGANGGPGGRTFAGGGGASIEGTVTAVTADSITITTASGQSVTLALDGTTTYHQQASASAGDVKSGGKVIVRLGLRAPGSGETQTGPTASDITIVP